MFAVGFLAFAGTNVLSAQDSISVAVPADSMAQPATVPSSHSEHHEASAHAPVSSNTVNVLDKLANHYYLDFKPVGKIELPRIFYSKDGGIEFYASTSAAIASGRWADDHGMVTKYGESYPASYHISPVDGDVHGFIDFSLSSHLVFFWFAGFLTLFIFWLQVRKYQAGTGRTTAPEGAAQNLLETLVIFIRDEVARPNIGEKYIRFTPYLLTAFFMILFMNLFGLVPWGVSSTADVTVTAVLAITTFLVTQLSASKDHWVHVFWFPGVPAWIRIILTPVEIIGLFTKPFALCIRLFANMASGKVLIYSIIGLIFVFYNQFGAGIAYGTSWLWVLFALFIFVIKVVVAFLQAYIFTMLSSLFIGLAVAEHHHEEHAH
jgi:F-type H+-transporting ATPase subunit a